jgi:hypothetical protein
MSSWRERFRPAPGHHSIRVRVAATSKGLFVEYVGKPEHLMLTGVASAAMLAPGCTGVRLKDDSGECFQGTRHANGNVQIRLWRDRPSALAMPGVAAWIDEAEQLETAGEPWTAVDVVPLLEALHARRRRGTAMNTPPLVGEIRSLLAARLTIRDVASLFAAHPRAITALLEDDPAVAYTERAIGAAAPGRCRMSALDFRHVYRAHVQAAGSECERTVYVEAISHEQAIKKITAVLEACEPWRSCANERVYNCSSAVELVEEGESDDVELRLFEVAWGGGRPPQMCRHPVFLVKNPGAWAAKWSAACRHGMAA